MQYTKLGRFKHQWRMLSWVTTMPRSARISSTSRKLKLKT